MDRDGVTVLSLTDNEGELDEHLGVMELEMLLSDIEE